MQPFENNSHIADLVRAHDRELYALALLAPENARSGLLALYALDADLAHIRHRVKEEMIGHIRYAWWRETLEKCYTGSPRQGHPVLEALQPMLPHIPETLLQTLVAAYAETFPEPPKNAEKALEALSLQWLSVTAPQAQKKWKKSVAIWRRHRERHGQHLRSWLLVKLLLSSLV